MTQQDDITEIGGEILASSRDPILRRRLTTNALFNPIRTSHPDLEDTGKFEVYIESLADQLKDAMSENDGVAQQQESLFDPLLEEETSTPATRRTSTSTHQERTLKKERRRSTFSKLASYLVGWESPKPNNEYIDTTEQRAVLKNIPGTSATITTNNLADVRSKTSDTKLEAVLEPKPVAEPQPLPTSAKDQAASKVPPSPVVPQSAMARTDTAVEAVELETIVPDIDQPPTMMPAWTSHEGSTNMMADRFGFKLFDARTKRRQISEAIYEHYEDFGPSSSDNSDNDVHTPLSTDPGLTSDSRSNRSQDDFEFARPPSIASIGTKHTYTSLSSITKSPRPLTPETTLKKSDAILQQNDTDVTTAKLFLLSQIDVRGADKVKQDRWDHFLRKLRDDRRKTLANRDNWLEQQELNLAGLGTGKVAKERLKELTTLTFGGIPMSMRPRLWAELTGAALIKTPMYYQELLEAKATDADKSCVEQIDLDINRTMPSNLFFAGTGVGVSKLRRVLLAYSRRDPVIGYCQGMNNIAATLLLTYPTEEDAFFVLIAIVERLLPQSYFTIDLLTSRADQIVLKHFVRELCPRIDRKLTRLGADLEAITFGWFLSVFTDCLPAEWLFRVWDVFFSQGHQYLFCVAIAILRIHEKELLAAEHVGEVYTILKELRLTRTAKVDNFIKMTAQVRATTKDNSKFAIDKLQGSAVAEIMSTQRQQS